MGFGLELSMQLCKLDCLIGKYRQITVVMAVGPGSEFANQSFALGTSCILERTAIATKTVA